MKLAVFPNDPIRAYLKTYGRKFKVKYFNPSNFFYEVHIISPFEGDNYRLSDNVYVHGIAGVFNKAPILSLFLHVMRAAAIIRNYNVDLIRSYNPLIAGLIAVITGKLTKRPVVVSVHTHYHLLRPFMSIPALLWGFLVFIEKLVLRASDGVICKSNHLKKYVMSLEKSLTNVRVIPNFVETDLFSPSLNGSQVRRKLGLNGKHMVLYVGRLESEKNVLQVVKSEVEVIKKVPETFFVYVGEGKLRNELIMLAKKLKTDARTIFVGEQPHETVAKFMAASDVVVCPYSGFVLLEAASSAKPIVALDLEWHSEVIKHMQTGILVKTNCLDETSSIKSLSEGIIWILLNPSQARTMGIKARYMALKRFSYEAVAKMEINFYREVVSKFAENSTVIEE